ncbi:DNA fragmentation factor subunit alpha-like [Limulus polyphemus]|uniref:DNAation factor subunit alpha-like n=1 Tax=Limulus polyphemus TaxID=6850 RepID=A0ABM1BB67_LIMPO|nr:DNA fragmentation factor subunit alpha-like [Limulus polyphemus]
MSSVSPKNHPYKVWSSDRQTKKAVVASSLEELRKKGAEKLGYELHPPLKVVLESDGTEVDDENYFRTRNEDTVFVLLRENERWIPTGVEMLRAGQDVVDAPEVLTANFASNCLEEILSYLRKDVALIFMLKEAQLELVADMNIDEHAISRADRDFLFHLQGACDRILIDRKEAEDTKTLLGLLKQTSDEVDSATAPKSQTESLAQSTSDSKLFNSLSIIRTWQQQEYGSTRKVDPKYVEENKVQTRSHDKYGTSQVEETVHQVRGKASNRKKSETRPKIDRKRKCVTSGSSSKKERKK